MQYPKLVESKTANSQVDIIEWNPGMDLLAIVFNRKSITCSRLLSLQKVWHREANGRISSVAWRPDGRVLAVGVYNEKTKDNECTLHHAESGKVMFSINKKSTITAVSWLRSQVRRPDKGHSFSHQLAHGQNELTILMISTDDGRISFYALGLFYLGDISLHNDRNCETVKTHMSTCLRYLTSLVHTKYTNHTTSSLRVMKLNLFYDRGKEIFQISKMYAKIIDELEFLDDTIKAMAASWADVLAGLDNKLSSYSSRRTQNPDDSGEGYTLISADELLQLLVVGFPSDNLEKFLADMSDKGLRKLNSAIEQTCLRVQNLVIKNAQKCCYHLHDDLNLLRGMSLWKERFGDVGLDDKPIVAAMKSVGAFILKLSEMNQVIDHSVKSTKAFFRWLISIAFRTTSLEQNSNIVQNDASKMTQQDIQLITDFILDNFDYKSTLPEQAIYSIGDSGELDASRPTCSNFTLGQVGQYLKSEPLTRLKYSFSKPGTNFWIEFFKKKPELVDGDYKDEDGSSILLLYPHNPETSLIQEYRQTCDTIEAAFKYFADNIKLMPKNEDDVVLLKDFIKNVPTQSVRVETDSRLMKHYVIFQVEQNPITKQYLTSQSLVDKTFKLASIEFQSIPDTHSGYSGTSTRVVTRTSSPNSLVIADSCFFEDRDSKSIMLTFLLVDETNDGTIFVQIDLCKILEHFETLDRPSKDLGKIFKTVETIDKMSTPIVLRLDLNTKPACNRQHNFDMMVKRINGTKGQRMFASSNRGVIAFTSSNNERIHLYELDTLANGLEIMEDETDCDNGVDESLIDPDLAV